MKFNIETVLSCATTGTVDLPISSWKDIKDYFVKWDTLHYTLDGEKWEEIELNSNADECIEWKRPCVVSIIDYETQEEIASYNQ